MNLLPANTSVLVLGSLNSNEADRSMHRSQIRPVQLLDGSLKSAEARFFSSWGEFGVSALAMDPRSPEMLYVATETRLASIDLRLGETRFLELDLLVDIHEITIIDGDLWVANTGNDEVIRHNLVSNRITERIPLGQFSKRDSVPAMYDAEVVDTFHCNQCFRDLDGDICVLVHHIEGRQILKRIAQKVMKSQGTGGILNLRTGRKIPLNLKAPHSVRICGSHYVVLNSGHSFLQVYDRKWRQLERIGTEGFGRGADFDANSGLFYAGISATRKRYLDLIPRGRRIDNMVTIFSRDTWKIVHQQVIEGVEQINNVYLIPNTIGERIMTLHGKAQRTG